LYPKYSVSMTTGKQQAILDGALAMFARDGYTRASLDAIAAASGVSTRTIYNHFHDKAQLFQAVILASSERVAAIHIGIIDRHLGKIVDLEKDLIEFGTEWTDTLNQDLAVHFAMVRQINAEIEHIPDEAYAAWQAAGPLRVRRHLAARLSRIADRGLLRVDDPMRAASHLFLLITGGAIPGRPGSPAEQAATVEAGVRAFLHGYAGPA
jgi:AcrR family transcriptional regulator